MWRAPWPRAGGRCSRKSALQVDVAIGGPRLVDGQRRPRNSTEAAAEAKEMEDERERLQGMASAANREIASLKKSMMVSFSFHKCVKDGNDE